MAGGFCGFCVVLGSGSACYLALVGLSEHYVGTRARGRAPIQPCDDDNTCGYDRFPVCSAALDAWATAAAGIADFCWTKAVMPISVWRQALSPLLLFEDNGSSAGVSGIDKVIVESRQRAPPASGDRLARLYYQRRSKY